ncbi:hypothetical protein Pcinc_042050 [Petrolisthes cinctipes]|uniref:Uncharacterized protein n=1 Tax=Petrolisthes cinctipes TaxID=88211 RepID=A0AAE1EJ88_PETCI|nr:hypothetical protein Pcinc_042050 [Petrolisthes cinctipes]
MSTRDQVWCYDRPPLRSNPFSITPLPHPHSRPHPNVPRHHACYLLKHCPHSIPSAYPLSHFNTYILRFFNTQIPPLQHSHPSFNVDPLNTSTSPLHQLHLSASTLTSFLYNCHKPLPLNVSTLPRQAPSQHEDFAK